MDQLAEIKVPRSYITYDGNNLRHQIFIVKLHFLISCICLVCNVHYEMQKEKKKENCANNEIHPTSTSMKFVLRQKVEEKLLFFQSTRARTGNPSLDSVSTCKKSDPSAI